MARYYKLIDSTGRAYITKTDREALAFMLAMEGVKAHTARKNYQIRGSQDLGRITDRLTKTLEDSRALDFEKRDAGRMLQTIEKELAAGRIFYELEVTEGGKPAGKYHYFA